MRELGLIHSAQKRKPSLRRRAWGWRHILPNRGITLTVHTRTLRIFMLWQPLVRSQWYTAGATSFLNVPKTQAEK